MGHYTELHIYDFGPFKEVHIELAPLIIFIGKNSLGKSMLLYLIWVLEKTLPDFNELYKVMDEMGALRLAEKCFNSIKAGQEPIELIYELLLMTLKAFPRAWAEALNNAFHNVYGVEIGELARLKRTDKGFTIIIEGEKGKLEVVGKDRISIKWLKLDESVVYESTTVLFIGDTIYIANGILTEASIASPPDVLKATVLALRGLLYDIFGKIAGVFPGVLLVDGRAGIMRVLLVPYPSIALTIGKEVLSADYEFLESTYKMARDYVHGAIDLNVPTLQLLLQELGFKATIHEEFGLPKIYMQSWTGQRLPLGSVNCYQPY